MFRHFSLWGCLAITVGIWWTCWLMVHHERQGSASRGTEGGRGVGRSPHLATSDLNQTNTVTLPLACSFCQACESFIVLVFFDPTSAPLRKWTPDISADLLPNWCVEHFCSEDASGAELNDIFSHYELIPVEISPLWRGGGLSSAGSGCTYQIISSSMPSNEHGGLPSSVRRRRRIAAFFTLTHPSSVCIWAYTPAGIPFPSLQPPIVFRAQKSALLFLFFFAALPSCFSLPVCPHLIWFRLPAAPEPLQSGTSCQRHGWFSQIIVLRQSAAVWTLCVAD